jgi:alpha-beta hydrolase superfamily lysophospholipase
VVVGGLARTDRSVDTVVLIAPSFSPTYDLSPALWRMRGRLHLFSSTGDTTFLKWRTGNFGTYDRIKTPAAGYAGADLSDLDPTLRARVVQHAWQSEWKSLGNDGGHFGGVSGAFVRQVVLPLFGDRDDAR